jgi:uncharacterized protein (DUF697 family)
MTIDAIDKPNALRDALTRPGRPPVPITGALLTKAGTSGLINLTKVVPIVGGLVGGAVDATVTRAIGAVARQVFKPLDDETSADPTVMPEPAALSGT